MSTSSRRDGLSHYVTVEVVLDHPRAVLWEMLSQPELYPRFFRAIGTVTRLPGRASDPPRYSVLATTGGHTVTYVVRMVTRRPAEKLVLAGVGESGSWVSVTLVEHRPRRTKITVVVAKPHGIDFGERQSRVAIQDWVRGGLGRIDDYLSGTGDTPLVNAGQKLGLKYQIAKTMLTSGVLWPPHPLRGPRQMTRLYRWGFNLAGGYGQAAARCPDDLALVDDRSRFTFAELYARAYQLTCGLIELGLRAEDTIAVLARNHAGMMTTVVAGEMLGLNMVLLNTGLAARQIEDLVERHQVRMLFADDEFEPLSQYLPASLPRVATIAPTSLPDRTTLDEIIATAPRRRLKSPTRHGNLIVLTSGTGGTPKGARRPPPGRWGTIAAMLTGIPLNTSDRLMICAPVFHSWGLASWQISTPIRVGVVVQDRFDAERCLRAIAEHRCTVLIAVPIMLQRILHLPAAARAKYDTSCLRIVASSGSVIPGATVTEFMDAFGDILYNFYGSTEVSWATVADPQELRAAPTTAGHPPLGTTVSILDPDGLPVPRGAVGRIFVGNEMLFDGYTEGGSADVKNKLMDTGDVGYVDADDRIFVSGRDDEMIISGGENVFPRPVEEALAALPQVSEVAVVGVPDPEYGQRLAAFIVPKDGARLDPAMVRSYVHHRLTRFSVPRDVTFLTRMPRNTTGKIIKRLLVERSA